MSGIPVISRLRIRDWVRLIVAVTILALEFLARVLFSWIPRVLIPGSVRNSCKRKLASFGLDTEKKVPKPIRMLATAPSSGSLARLRHFPFETHYCPCKDDYIITLHRLPRHGGPVVLLWHGFMMSSEVWLCHADANNSLAYVLHSLGYDVWLGNTRGNKYSWKHEKKGMEKSREYYDYSLDEMAKFDVPNCIDFILKFTEKEKLSYIGFSQGTAQGFAALSLSADVQKKVNIFIALAAIMKPKVLANSIANALVQASPELVFLIFGRERMIPMAHFWTSVLPRSLLVEIMDRCLLWLFGWTASYISDVGKYIYYGHLYSYTSVKSNVHWFQIMHSDGGFYMYDEYPSWFRRSVSTDGDSDGSSGYAKQRFPVEQIRTPIAIFSGGRDTLCDIPFLKRCLGPSLMYWLEVEEYEHLDFLWAEGVDALVIPAVVGLLREYADKPVPVASASMNQSEVRTITYEALGPNGTSGDSSHDRLSSGDGSALNDYDFASPLHSINEDDIQWLLNRGRIKNNAPPRGLKHDIVDPSFSTTTSVSGSLTGTGQALFEHNTISARQFKPKRLLNTPKTAARYHPPPITTSLDYGKPRPGIQSMVRQLSTSITIGTAQFEKACQSLLGLADPRTEAEVSEITSEPDTAKQQRQLPIRAKDSCQTPSSFPPYAKRNVTETPMVLPVNLTISAETDSDTSSVLSSFSSAESSSPQRPVPATPKSQSKDSFSSNIPIPFSTPTKQSRASERL